MIFNLQSIDGLYLHISSSILKLFFGIFHYFNHLLLFNILFHVNCNVSCRPEHTKFINNDYGCHP